MITLTRIDKWLAFLDNRNVITDQEGWSFYDDVKDIYASIPRGRIKFSLSLILPTFGHYMRYQRPKDRFYIVTRLQMIRAWIYLDNINKSRRINASRGA